MPKGQYIREKGFAHGIGSSSNHRRVARIARLTTRVFELREQGMTKKLIAKTLHISDINVDRILHDQENIRRRLAQYNEQLRAASPIAIKVIYEVLNSESPNQLGERAAMARWVLESSKIVGKESPVNIFVGGGASVQVSNDTVEAARQVAALMRGQVQALPAAAVGEVIDAEEIKIEENSNEHIEGAVGVVGPGIQSGGGSGRGTDETGGS